MYSFASKKTFIFKIPSVCLEYFRKMNQTVGFIRITIVYISENYIMSYTLVKMGDGSVSDRFSYVSEGRCH